MSNLFALQTPKGGECTSCVMQGLKPFSFRGSVDGPHWGHVPKPHDLPLTIYRPWYNLYCNCIVMRLFVSLVNDTSYASCSSGHHLVAVRYGICRIFHATDILLNVLLEFLQH